MEDAQIIDHFFRRDPEAIRAAQEKYEKRCLAAARHILPDARDAEECVSDVWLRLWNAIPPERPRSLAAYITTVTRRLALDKCDYNRAAQRRSDLTVAFEELEGCLPAEDGAVRALEQQEFRRVLNGFLRKLTRQSRTLFHPPLLVWREHPRDRRQLRRGRGEGQILPLPHPSASAYRAGKGGDAVNDNRMKRWMDAIDDDLLEEAQRPLPRGGAARRWGALAACFCAAALALALWQPWSAGIGDNTAGADADFGAMDKSFSVAMPPVSDAELLSASLALPEGASLASDYRWHQDGEGAVTGVSCTVLLDGYDYDYSAAYASQPLPAPDGTLPTDTYQVNGLTLLVYDDGAVGWYDTSAGIQWYCAAWDGGAPLVTAFTLMDAQYYTVPTAPEGADVLGYDLFDLDGATVTEVAFTLDGVTWHYRMAPTLDVSETIPDISGFTGGSLTAEGKLRWCPTVLRWDAGGAGCIIWRDLAPGLAYSLTADTGASEDALSDMAALVFKPAQEES